MNTMMVMTSMRSQFGAICAIVALTLSPLASRAASLSAFAGTIAGYSGNIAGGCTTSGPPAELAFFPGSGAGLQIAGGNAACGFSGGWKNLTSANTAQLINSAALEPTRLGTAPTAKSFDATADSRATYGSLSARAHGHYSGPVVSYYDNASAAAVAAATFSDTLTATLPANYIVPPYGFVRYQFTLDGSANSPGPGTAFSNGSTLTAFNIQHDDGPIYGLLSASTRTDSLGDIRGAAAASGWTAGNGSLSGASTFESGLFLVDLTKSWNFEAGLITTIFGNADNDFYSTAKLVGIELFDAQSRPIDNYSIASASGVNYLAAAVPEPNSSALLAAGLLVLVAAARVRHARGGACPWPANSRGRVARCGCGRGCG